MPRRTRDEVLAEFHRLYDCFEAAIEAFQGLGTMWEREILSDHVATRDQMLFWIALGKSTPSQILAGVHSALADMRLGLKDMTRNRPDQAALFHHRYEAIRGRPFKEDAARQPKPETRP
ncbi:hypothetical protein ACN2XU_12230 [Primorskyibacter sp. 2E107]|uniref:hypothetical protein n=1 Tax=Primorskyibacter sp. 2E107 TaxID=3403458 RepID=UPI003AF7FF18